MAWTLQACQILPVWAVRGEAHGSHSSQRLLCDWRTLNVAPPTGHLAKMQGAEEAARCHPALLPLSSFLADNNLGHRHTLFATDVNE